LSSCFLFFLHPVQQLFSCVRSHYSSFFSCVCAQ
jgi:hypothetical protein